MRGFWHGENRRLQREVEELRAMRVAPPTVLSPHTRQPLPASALTMCPRCERITAATGAPAARTPRPAAAANPFHPRRPSAVCVCASVCECVCE